MRTPISGVRRVTTCAISPNTPTAARSTASIENIASSHAWKRRIASDPPISASTVPIAVTGADGSSARISPRTAAASASGSPSVDTSSCMFRPTFCVVEKNVSSREPWCRPRRRMSPTTPTMVIHGFFSFGVLTPFAFPTGSWLGQISLRESLPLIRIARAPPSRSRESRKRPRTSGTSIVSKKPGDTMSVVASICSEGGNGGRSSRVNIPELGVLLRNRVDVTAAPLTPGCARIRSSS